METIYGLVLAGGKSKRMGQDKGLLDYYGKPQRYYLADMLQGFCEQVYISCRADQTEEIEKAGYRALPDREEDSNQFEAILNALKSKQEVAWLVLACDLPLVSRQEVALLLESRDKSKYASSFMDKKRLPEPLIAIWEPSARTKLQDFKAQGISCPRKSLIKLAQNVKLIKPLKEETIINANTPQDAKKVRQLIGTRRS